MPWLTTYGPPILPCLFTLGFVWLSLAVGRRLLAILGATQDATHNATRNATAYERGIVAAALGAGALQFVPFALGAAGLLHALPLAVAFAVVAALVARDLVAVARAVVAHSGDIARTERWTVAWALALVPALAVAALVALGPTTDPDGLAYHLTVGKRWLEHGTLDYLPTYPYSNAPMGVEMLFTVGLAFAGDSAAKCVHLVLGTLGVIGLYFAGRRLKSPVVGAVAASFFLVGPAGVCNVLGWGYVEGGAAFAMIAASLAWILARETGQRAWLRAAALLAGVAVTFKITSVLFPAAMFALTVLDEVDPARADAAGDASLAERVIAAIFRGLRLVPLMLAPIVPWMTRAAVVTGNPLYPLFARWIPSRDLSPDLSTKFDKFNRYMTWGNVFGRSWGLPQREHVLLGVCAVVALLGGIGVFRLRTWLGRSAAAVATMALLAQLSAAGLYIRYSIPLVSVIMLLVAAAFADILSRRNVPAVVAGLTLVASLAQAKRTLAQGDSDLAGLAETAVGLEGRKAYLLQHMPPYPLYDVVNHDLPPDAKVLLSCRCAGFYIDRNTFCADMIQDSLRLTTWEDFTADLKHLGITHVIAPTVLATGGPSPPFELSSTSSITREAQYRLVRELLTAHARVRATASDTGLYELDPALVGAR